MNQMTGGIALPGGLSLRFAGARDEEFLLRMFKAARPWLELGSHDRDFIQHLYEEQKRITRLGTGSVYPEHLDFIIEESGRDVGHLIIDLGYGDWRITQLEIHPEGQGRGYGSNIIHGIQAAAEKVKLPLTVATPMMMGRVLQFYGRLGFMVRGQNPPMVELIWLPSALRKDLDKTLLKK